MTIPSKIKIGAIVYDIKEVDVEELPLNTSAELNTNRNLIRIRKDLPNNQKEVTLLHECLHGLNQEISEETSEWWAQGIYQILSDNDLLK